MLTDFLPSLGEERDITRYHAFPFESVDLMLCNIVITYRPLLGSIERINNETSKSLKKILTVLRCCVSRPDEGGSFSSVGHPGSRQHCIFSNVQEYVAQKIFLFFRL